MSAVPEVTQKASSMPGHDHEFYLTSAKRMKTFCKWPYLAIVSSLPQVLCDQVPSHGETQANDLGWGVALQEVNHHTVIVPCVTAREDPRRCHLKVMRYAHYTQSNKGVKILCYKGPPVNSGSTACAVYWPMLPLTTRSRLHWFL